MEPTTMNATRGYYSLVQYCPDLARQEAANPGVHLCCPERGFIRAKLTDSLAHIRRCFGHAAGSDGHIAGMLRGLVNRIEIEQADFKSLEDLLQFVATRANKVILTSPKIASEPNEDTRGSDTAGHRKPCQECTILAHWSAGQRDCPMPITS